MGPYQTWCTYAVNYNRVKTGIPMQVSFMLYECDHVLTNHHETNCGKFLQMFMPPHSQNYCVKESIL